MPQCIITSYPVAAAAATGVTGFIAGYLIAATKRRSQYQSGDDEVVEIYVGNLSYDMSEAQMRREFERYGKVSSARIISNRLTKRSKGFGFVEMPDRAEAEAAIRALNERDVLGRKLRVNEAKNKSRN